MQKPLCKCRKLVNSFFTSFSEKCIQVCNLIHLQTTVPQNQWCRTNNLTATATASGKSGIDSALADQWVKKLKEKVWVVNAAHGGSSIITWLPKKGADNNFWQAVALYKACERTLNKEIKAGLIYVEP